DGVHTLVARGVRTFVELGPDGVLGSLVQDTLDADDGTLTLALLRKDRSEAETLLAGLGALHVRGVTDATAREAFFAGTGARPAGLPTYAFQRERYWLRADAGPAGAGGPHDTGHPLLGTGVSVAGTGDTLFTARVLPTTHGWTAGHAVLDAPVLPPAALVDALTRAALETGAGALESLTVRTPLVLPDNGAAQLQTVIHASDDSGRRPFSVHLRPDDPASPWTQHAHGFLAADHRPAGPVRDGGHHTGVRLPEELLPDATAYGIHPALLDEAARTVLGTAEPDSVRTAVEWHGVRLYATGATDVRVLAEPGEDDTVSLRLVGTDGQPVLTVERLVFRDVPTAQFASTDGALLPLYAMAWQPVPPPRPSARSVRWALLDEPAPKGAADLDALRCPDLAAVAAAVREGTPVEAVLVDLTGAGKHPRPAHRALLLTQQWLEEEHLQHSRLVFLTRGAVDVAGEGVDDPEAAAAWGLLASAQAEAPDRIVVLDTDHAPVSASAMSSFLATEEPQAALRDGTVHIPRLRRAEFAAQGTPADRAARWDPRGTVLITGGGGALADLFARHLVTEHGVRRLLLLDRRAEGAWPDPELLQDLREAGAEVTVTVCDVANRRELGAALAAIPEDHALTGVVHTAAVLDNALLPVLTPDRLEAVMRAKADAALHLHELTRDHDLDAFVLFSASVGAIGGPGQANYAAANAFLDGLARHRAARGLPATSLAWGLWDIHDGINAGLSDQYRARFTREGFRFLGPKDGTRAFDAALRTDAAALVALPVDAGAMRAHGQVPAVLSSLVRIPPRPRSATAAPAGPPLDGPSPQERHKAVLDLVRAEAAAVLGHTDTGAVTPDRAFQELGFDSMTAVELRNRITRRTGVRLSATLAFDHPSPDALAGYLLAQLAPDEAMDAPSPAVAELERLTALLTPAPENGAERDEIVVRLQTLLSRLTESGGEQRAADPMDDIASASAEEIFALIDNQLG
ncbi:SDR family NAD(P)-dependent oxidoreductase, partial [Streptomyces sp. ISL-112]|uniref:type I polyketide synthase n=1 Tax=Streptomyces sp. ISL-112 TaxID=2819176 RepID=UPI001BE61A44